jgi:tRNA uridine 5-carbamoylmethylation protein Kti12
MLKVYKAMLRQVMQQYEAKNGNQLWRSVLSKNFRENPEKLTLSDAENILTYLQGAGEYNRLMSLYWPEEPMTELEKIKKTANRVGLSVPDCNVDQPSKDTFELGNDQESKKFVN